MPEITAPAEPNETEGRGVLDSIGQLLRPELADLVAYVPHDPPGIEVKLDANEAPPCSAIVREVVARAIASVALERYPDPRALRLKEAIALRTGAKVEDLLVGTGSDEAIALVTSDGNKEFFVKGLLEDAGPAASFGGQVVVTGDRDQRPTEAPGHVLDETRLAATGRPLEHDGQAVRMAALEDRHLVAAGQVVRRRDRIRGCPDRRRVQLRPRQDGPPAARRRFRESPRSAARI